MSDHKKLNTLVERLVHATDPEEVKQLYRQWSESYDSDLKSFGYVAPPIGVRLLQRRVPDVAALVHDAGCGTGLVGSLLSDAGYKNIHGSDFSDDMLAKATVTQNYSQLQPLDFSELIPVESNTYAGVISIGVYTKRFNNHFLDEMIRITMPGGWFVFSARELYFDEIMQQISTLLKKLVLQKTDIRYDKYMVEQNASAYYFCLQKTLE